MYNLLQSTAKQWTLSLGLMVCLHGLTTAAHAQEAVDKTSTEVKATAPAATLADDSYWLILGGISRHSCRTCGFRESNPGLALQWSPAWLKEYAGSNDWRLTAGAYINSNNRNSVYAGVQWLPIEYGVVKAGVQAAVITNYLEKSVLPTLLPVISIETRYVGADIFLVPKFPSVSSALLVSFKVRY
jgi:hypothetical protein